jgi:hypothetical protein
LTPAGNQKLPGFNWFDAIRPKNKLDIFDTTPKSPRGDLLKTNDF